MRAIGKNQGRGAGRKKGRKGKAKASKPPALQTTPSQPPSHPLEKPQKANVRALLLLREHPDAEYSLTSMASHLGMGERGARLILGKLVKAGAVRTSAPGMYTAGKFSAAS
jgi:hypothetical protein